MAKVPTITAGPSSGNDRYTVTEDQVVAGTIFNVLANDPKKTTLYSLDNRDVSDLLKQDQILLSEQSQLGNSIWITASGQVGYSAGPNGSQIQSLAAGETSTDAFLYADRQGNGSLVWFSVQVTITGVNDAPVARADNGAVVEDAVTTGTVAFNDSDVDHGAVLQFATAGQLPAGFAMATDGNWSFDGSNPAYQSLRAGETMSLAVAYTVTDEHGASSSSILTLTLTGTNDAPAVSGTVLGTASEDGVATSLGALSNATDADHNASLSVVNVPPAEGLPAGVTYDASTGKFTLDPSDPTYQQLAGGETVIVTVNYGVSDGTATTPASVSWTVTGANDKPITTSPAGEVVEGASTSGQLTALDPDHGTELVFAVVGDAPEGLSLAADGSWTFDASGAAYDGLAANEIRIVEVPFSVTDDRHESSTAVLTIAVTGSNDAPVLENAPATLPSGVEDTAFTVTQEQLVAGWIDPDGDAVAASGLSVAHATVNANSDGSFTITPDANYAGALLLDYSVGDGTESTAASLGLTIGSVNDPAHDFTGTSGSINEDGAASGVSGDAGFVDPDNPNDSWLPVANPSASDLGYGTFTVSADGVWHYDLNNTNPAVDALNTGQSLVDTFTLTTSDGTTTQVSVTINGHTDYVYVTPPVSTAPDANDFDSLRSDQTKPSTLFNFTATGSDEVLDGSNGNDLMRGQGGSDQIYGHGGNDRLLGELDNGTQPPPAGVPGNDVIYGQAGNDFLMGGLGSDTLYGGSGADELYGNNSLGSNPETVGNSLYGGSGNDRLYGDSGNDVLVGGTGADWLTGGAGSDRFVLTSAADTGDLAFDFQHGVDKLDLSALGLNSSNFVGALSSPGMVGPGQVGYMTVMGGSQMDTVIYIDTDGVFGADLEIRLVGTPQFSSNDILW